MRQIRHVWFGLLGFLLVILAIGLVFYVRDGARTVAALAAGAARVLMIAIGLLNS